MGDVQLRPAVENEQIAGASVQLGEPDHAAGQVALDERLGKVEKAIDLDKEERLALKNPAERLSFGHLGLERLAQVRR